MRSKAQTATEYMIILAIVIILALILAGVLGQFPTLGGSARARSSSAYWQSAEIGIVAYAISDDNNNDDVTLKLKNNNKGTITIESVRFDGSVIYNTPTVIGPGMTKTLEINSAGDYCIIAGDSYTIDVEIEYEDDETGETFVFDGNGNKLEGRCAQ